MLQSLLRAGRLPTVAHVLPRLLGSVTFGNWTYRGAFNDPNLWTGFVLG